MIEVVSSPANLEDWHPATEPFYLELYGEGSPLVDEAYAEVVPAGGTDPKDTADAPVYEYWWSLGHPGAPESHHWWLPWDHDDEPPWRDLENPAARIYMYFPVSAGWRAKELVATLKYLSPVPEERDWLKDAAQVVQPLLGGASSLAGLIPGGATPSKWLEAISKLQISSLPQTKALEWSVGKVTFGSPAGVMQGVMWTLSRDVFDRLGGRLTGSLAVSLIPARQQEREDHIATSRYGSANVLAHAVVYGRDTQYWVPGGDPHGRNFLKLEVAPRSPVVGDGKAPLTH